MELKVKSYQDIRDLCDLLGGKMLEGETGLPSITAMELGVKRHVFICKLDHEVNLDQLKIVGGVKLEFSSSEFGKVEVDFSKATFGGISCDRVGETEVELKNGNPHSVILYDVPFAGFVITSTPTPAFTYEGELTLVGEHPVIHIHNLENIEFIWESWSEFGEE